MQSKISGSLNPSNLHLAGRQRMSGDGDKGTNIFCRYWDLARLDALVKDFQSRLARLNKSRKRADELLLESRTTIRDCELIYEVTFLAAMAFFEDTLEKMLIEMVLSGRGKQKGSFSLINVRSRDVMASLISGGDQYSKMLPLENTIRLAERFLNPPAPFNLNDQGDKSRLAEAGRIRNAIAHRSSHALNTFRSKVTGVSNLASNKRYPGPFLRDIFRTGPDVTRHELYFEALRKISMDICSQW